MSTGNLAGTQALNSIEAGPPNRAMDLDELPLSPLRLGVRRFAQNKLAVAGAITLAVIVLAVLLAPLLTPYNPVGINLVVINKAPSAAHWLGTDEEGRDVFSRLLYGGRVSLEVGVLSAGLAVLIGVALGGLAAMFGSFVDSAVTRLADVVLSLPTLVVVIVIAGILGPSEETLVLAIAAFSWPTTCRIVRGVALKVREQEYVLAASSSGASRWWIIRRHIIPAAVGQIVVTATLLVATTILLEAGLSFLGLGVQLPTSSWGNMLTAAESLQVIQYYPWQWLPPGLAIAITVLAVNFVGDGLRDATNPRHV